MLDAEAPDIDASADGELPDCSTGSRRPGVESRRAVFWKPVGRSAMEGEAGGDVR